MRPKMFFRLALALALLVLLLWAARPRSGDLHLAGGGAQGERPSQAPAPPAVSAPHRRSGEVGPPAELGGSAELELTLIWESSGRPAAGVGFTLLQDGRILSPRDARTDVDGRAQVPRLPLASYRLAVDRGWRESIDLDRPGRVEHRVLLPDGFGLRGRVLTHEGTPVEGAEILLGSQTLRVDQCVTRSERDGSFELLGVLPPWCLQAVHAEFGTSDLRCDYELPPGDPIDLHLNRHSNARLYGRVLGEGGLGLPQAQVLLYSSRPGQPAMPGFGPLRLQVTGSEGGFELLGLAAGRWQLQCSHPRFEDRLLEVVLEPGERQSLDVELRRGHVLTGRVLDPEGRGAAAYVQVSQPPSPRTCAAATCDPEGSFELHGLPGGVVFVHATHGALRVVRELHLSGAASVELRLERIPEIRGRLRQEDGSPLAGWKIGARTPAELRGLYLAQATSGAQGDFSLAGFLEPGADYVIEARPADAESGPPLAARSTVAGSGEEVELVVETRSLPSARIAGLLLAPPGISLAGVTLALSQGPNTLEMRRELRLEGDHFELGPLPAGRHHLLLLAPWIQPELLGWHRLHPDELLDLGSIALRPAGRLCVVLAPPPTRVRPRVSLIPMDRAGAGFSLPVTDGIAHGNQLAPGRYRLEVEAPGLRPETRELSIEAGRETRLELELTSFR